MKSRNKSFTNSPVKYIKKEDWVDKKPSKRTADSKKKMIELFKMYKASESDYETQKYFDQLCDCIRPLVFLTLRKFTHEDGELLTAAEIEGYLISGMYKASNKFDITKENANLLQYSMTTIKNEFFQHLRKNERHSGNVSLNNSIVINEKENDEVELLDTISSEFDVEDIVLQHEMSEMLMDSMRLAKMFTSERKYQVFCFRFIGYMQREIGEMMNLSQTMISRDYRTFKEMAKNIYENLDLEEGRYYFTHKDIDILESMYKLGIFSANNTHGLLAKYKEFLERYPKNLKKKIIKFELTKAEKQLIRKKYDQFVALKAKEK